jgi:hypothetical protein
VPPQYYSFFAKDFGENFEEKNWRERKNFEREIFEKK